MGDVVARGDLFEQGEPGDRAYILVNGRLQAVGARPRGRARRSSARSRAARSSARWRSSPASHGVPACGRCATASSSPSIAQAFDQLIVALPADADGADAPRDPSPAAGAEPAQAESPARTFAVIAAGPRRAARGLRASPRGGARGGSARRCTSPRRISISHLGTPGLAQTPLDDPRATRVASWIDEQETRHRFVILEADVDSVGLERTLRPPGRPPARGGTRRRRSDAGRGRASRSSAARGRPRRRRASSSSTRPRRAAVAGTSRWLEGRALVRHHHVRDGDEADVGACCALPGRSRGRRRAERRRRARVRARRRARGAPGGAASRST